LNRFKHRTSYISLKTLLIQKQNLKMSVKFDHERAKAIGRSLFQKYDIYKSSVLQPKQCYELFSDFCYRILVLSCLMILEPAKHANNVRSKLNA
jgi:hypothetical protein